MTPGDLARPAWVDIGRRYTRMTPTVNLWTLSAPEISRSGPGPTLIVTLNAHDGLARMGPRAHRDDQAPPETKKACIAVTQCHPEETESGRTMTTTTREREIRTRAVELIREGGLCKGAAARTRHGDPTEPRKRSARSFCALGAMERAAHELCPGDWATELAAAWASADGACRARRGRTLLQLNDDPGTTVDDVLEALRP